MTDGGGEARYRPLWPLRRLRRERGMTQSELSALSGVGQNSLSDIERGARTPQIGTLKKLANALGVPVEDLDARAHVPPEPPDASWAIASSDRRFARHLKEESLAEILAALPVLNREAGAAMEAGDGERKLRAVRRFMAAAREWQDRVGPLMDAPPREPSGATTGEPADAGERHGGAREVSA